MDITNQKKLFYNICLPYALLKKSSDISGFLILIYLKVNNLSSEGCTAKGSYVRLVWFG